MMADLVEFYKVMGCNVSLNVHFSDSYPDAFPENFVEMRKSAESDFASIFLPWKSHTKASGVYVCWLITAGHLEETFHR